MIVQQGVLISFALQNRSVALQVLSQVNSITANVYPKIFEIFQ